jgi:C-terminal processing protease CtpA/Prc
LAVLLVPGLVFAQDVIYQAVATDTPPSPDEKRQDAALEAQLDAAREKLQEAAREVAELSTQLNKPLIQKFSTFNGAFGRAIIGVQLDPAGGKDGARILEVSPGGPAAEAGIRPGDVIVAVNGTEVKGEDASRQIVKIIRDVKPDTPLNVRVLRDGKTRDFTVTPRPGPDVMAFGGGPGLPALPDMPPMNRFFIMQGPLSNMELATLTPQLGRYFGADKGVLVVRAPPDGALKLEDGDVILAIDGREPKSGSHATRILGSYQPGEKLTLRVMRQHKMLDLEATVPEDFGGRRKAIMLRGGDRDAVRGGGPETAPIPGKVVIMHGDETT